MLVIDASQSLGHIDLRLGGSYFTALCSAGHKALFGIQGSAFALINDAPLFDTLTEGGSGVDSFSRSMPLLLPERYEAGTMATPAIAGLNAGIEFINEIGIKSIQARLSFLTEILQDKLSSIPDIEIYGAEQGIASFNLRDLPSSYVSSILDKANIATRPGYHCAPLLHRKLNTQSRGAVRASISYFNTEYDITRLTDALRKI